MSNILSYFAVKGFLADIAAPAEIRACLDDLMPAVVQAASQQRVHISQEEVTCLLQGEDKKSRKRMGHKRVSKTPALDKWAEKEPDYS